MSNPGLSGSSVTSAVGHFSDVTEPATSRVSLTPAQREQLAQRLQGSRRRPVIDLTDRFKPLPLSFMQEQLCVHQDIRPESIVYHRPVNVRITGPLDPSALKRSLSEIVRRHEVFRTVLRFEHGQPNQVILPEYHVEVPETDLSARSQSSDYARQAVEDELRRPIDIRRSVLWRVRLFHRSDNVHDLLITFHHLIFDYLSESILLRELSESYAAFVGGGTPNFEKLPIQYADFAAWQRGRESTEEFHASVEYWKDKLRDLPTLQFLTDRPKSDMPGETADSVSIVLSHDLVDGLRRIGQREEATLFMLLLSAWSALLSRYTGQTDLVLGCPVAGRLRPEFERLIGLFINTLLLRVTFANDLTFRELLQVCRHAYLEAMKHQEVTLQQITRQALAPQGRGGSTGFDVMFVFEKSTETPYRASTTTFESTAVALDAAMSDLRLELSESRLGVEGKLVYRTELWDRPTIERMVHHFQTLLNGIVAAPDTLIVRLPLLTDAERQQLLVDWNQTATDYPRDKCVHELFEEQVCRTPGAPAVKFESLTLTYRELNARANRLAHRLRTLGVGPDVPVGVCAERSIEMVVALLAVLKAGGAYVPLDPTYPPDRLAFMLADVATPVLLTQERHLARLKSTVAKLVCLDRDWADIEREPDTDPGRGELRPDHLAYIIYTSGSTGRPKGAMNTHKGIVNRLVWMQDTLRLTSADVVLQKTPFGFDVSVWEFFWPLMVGARLVMPSPGRHVDFAYLADLISREGISMLHFVPSMLNAFLDAAPLKCQSIRLVQSSGEALPVAVAERFFARFPGVELFNLYGPTEAGEVSFWPCVHGDSRRSVPIGRPIANIQLYILDTQMQPVPVGVPGELHIGGIGLARGYWNRPDLTAEKFVPHPFHPTARLYKTGDLARFWPDGVIEYLGRLDQQVKVRGFRIEVEEIEAVMGGYPAVREAVVNAVRDTSGDTRLVGYVVPRNGSIDVADLRRHLAARLPEYMIPSAFVTLAALPLSPNGKRDRAVLPARTQDRPANVVYVAPRSAIEQQLASIWCEILGLKTVGIHDNFFALGGNSLPANRVMARIRTTFDVELSLRSLFEGPTIADQAKQVAAAQRDHGANLERLQPIGSPELIGRADTEAQCRDDDRLQHQRRARQRIVEQTPRFIEFPKADIQQSIPSLFARQVRLHGTRLAICAAKCQWTYLELERIASHIARRILDLCGSEPEPVLLLQRQSAFFNAAILGTLKAGKFYVPIDPSQPEHFRKVLESTAARLIITNSEHRALADDVACDTGAVIDIDEIDFAMPIEQVGVPVDPSATAYVIFTSGSTGPPKGCLQTHRNVLHYIRNYTNSLRIGSDDRLSLLAGSGYSAAAMDAFSALLSGAALFPKSLRDDGLSDLAGWLNENRITVYHSTATVFRSFLSQLTKEDIFPHLRIVDLGGDCAYNLDAERFQKQVSPQCVLVVGYGASELNVISQYLIDRETTVSRSRVPVGYSVEDTDVLIVDDLRNAVEQGEVGEIVIRSDYLSPGYWGQSEAAAYWNDTTRSGARCYCTGDIGRILDDGCLEHLGRNNSRVKFSGQWIDLTDTETALRRCEFVRDALVISHERSPDNAQIVAYYVPEPDTAPTVSAFRKALRQVLPDFMIPHRFVAISSIPLTANSKLDRSFRQELGYGRPPLDATYVSPRNALEKELEKIWAELLDVQGIGIHDDFFDLGGHSLLAARVMARIASALKVDLPPRTLFENPTIAALSAVIEILRSDEQRSPGVALRHVDRAQLVRVPLSFGQQRLWFLEQLEGKLTAYNLPYAWRIRGALDMAALQRALETVVRRHEPLRTTFARFNDEPAQVIGTGEEFELPLHDLSLLGSEQQETEIVQHCRSEAERPFDLSRDLMLRASVLRLSESEHVLLLTMHHIASDGWSMQVLWREIELLYCDFCGGVEAELPKLPVQYVDFAVWQRGEIQSRRLERLLQYWRQQLMGISTLELPTDRARPARSTYRGAEQAFELKERLIDRLQGLGQAEGVTLNMTLLAAFQALLSRYCHQYDIAVGVPIAGRNHAYLEGLIGFFVNTLVLRTDLSGNPTFRELLSRVRKVSLDAYDHQDLPFEKLVEALQPERQSNRSPLVQVMFQVASFTVQDLTLRDLEVSRLPSTHQRVRFDLEMLCRPRGKALHGTLAYSTDLFDRATIERLASCFVTLLEDIVADPDTRLAELPLLTEAEQHQLLVEWNNTAVEYPRDKCVHELFEEQAARTPDAIAVVFEDQELTYRDLNERANQLAHHLIDLGVGPETLVGLCLERSPELIVAILGILKAGGAYVPLDADYPSQRLAFMLQDAAVGHLVTQKSLLERLSAHRCQVTCVDSDAMKPEAGNCSNPSVAVRADNLAYVMYTSGSTGIPKGVAIRHSSISRLVFGNTYTTFGPDRVFLHLASASFDASTFELWGSLLHGAKLVVAHASLPDFRQLEVLLKRNQVTTLWLTATLFNQLVEQYPQALNNVSEILTGGEALSVRHICMAQAVLGAGVRLINGYGPTENTTFTTCFQIPSPLDPETKSVPIGRPIANTQVYVLDTQRQPTPIGAPGELYIGGTGLARGYLNRPELTAEKFVTNPFDDDPNSRLYRTGDLCCWRADGNLEFLGRLDDQVKLRGFRIELGEIETILNEHTDVAQSVVIQREDRPGDKRLVAYCVAAANTELSIAKLRNHLRHRLPDYMVPAAFVVMDKLPLTLNGKVDRHALPAPDGTRPEVESGYIVPRNSIEQQLADIWHQFLGIENVGIHDNFFALGGHSLLAAQMVDRANRELGMKLDLPHVFRTPTVAGLCMATQSALPREQAGSQLEVIRAGSGVPVVVVGDPNCLSSLLTRLPRETPLFWLRIDGIHGLPIRIRPVPEMAAAMAAELGKAVPHGRIVLVGFSFGGMIAVELARQFRAVGRELDVVALEPPVPGLNAHSVRKAKIAAKGLPENDVHRHAKAIAKLKSGAAVKYLWARIRERARLLLKNTLMRPYFTLLVRIGGCHPSVKYRWWYYKPHMESRIFEYKDLKYPGTVHLVGRDEWRAGFWHAWTEERVKQSVWHEVPGVTDHREIVVMPHAATWVDLVANLTKSKN